MKRCFVLLAVLLFSAFSAAYAQAPKFSNEFLKIGVGARALGMSNAFIATADDVTSGYWNPAGLVNMENDFQFSIMHSEYFAGIANYDYGAFATKIDSVSTFGISIIRFGVDDIPNTTLLIDNGGNPNFDLVTSFSVADYAALISYSRKSKLDGLSFGGNFKLVRRIIGDFADAWGFGLDFGLQYRKDEWTFAAVGRDVTSTFNAWTSNPTQDMIDVFLLTDNEIPDNSVEVTLPELVLGVNRRFIFNDKVGMRAELNLRTTFDGKRNVLIKSDPVSIDPNFGFELTYDNLIFLRGGVGNVQITTDIDGNRLTTYQPNFGLGIKLPYVSIDYALTDVGDRSVALFSNVFSIRLDIDRKPKK